VSPAAASWPGGRGKAKGRRCKAKGKRGKADESQSKRSKSNRKTKVKYKEWDKDQGQRLQYQQKPNGETTIEMLRLKTNKDRCPRPKPKA
jgi:hypothetical protein